MNSIGFDLSGLTEEQRRVVTHMDGPAVVIACPGSGKTRALTHRMGYLIQQQVPPAAILGITFTRAAAAEMKTRLAQLVSPSQASGVRLFTFHGLAWRIISDVHGRPNLLDERRQKMMARQLLREFRLNADQTSVDNLVTDFSFLVGAQVPLTRFRPGSCEPGLFRRVWGRYRELKAEQGLLDFDDLIVQARDLLRDSPAHRQAQVSRIRHLLVDEFQDTNALQWEFLQLLIPPGDNIMVVGDDDQAIYGWRGASPSFMLDFPRRFPGCAQLRLSRNFRSTASIVEPAGKLIAVNTRRFAKRFAAERAPAKPTIFVRPAGASDEADQITAAIRDQLAAGVSPNDLAVLYRTHLLAYPLMNRLDKEGISFRVLGGPPNPFTRWMARDALAYIRWAYGQASLEEIIRVLQRPSRRGISEELVRGLQQAKVEPGKVLDWLDERVNAAGKLDVRFLRANLQKLTQTPAGKAIRFIRTEMEYNDHIERYCRWAGSDPQEALEVLSALEQIPEPGESSRVYIDLADQAAHRKETNDPDGPAVTLSSFHRSKGLEWAQVWLLSSVDGAIPYRLAIEGGRPGALEEERRLFYVGMTRAKDVLTISAPRELLGADAKPSRFVTEAGIWSPPPPERKVPRPRKRASASAEIGPLPPMLPREDYAPGTVCWHPQFGDGVIRRVHKGIVEVYFRRLGKVKTLSLEVCTQAGLLRAARG